MSVSVFTYGAGRGAASGVTVQNTGRHTVGSGFGYGSSAAHASSRVHTSGVSASTGGTLNGRPWAATVAVGRNYGRYGARSYGR